MTRVDARVEQAVVHFWSKRLEQSKTQGAATGKKDPGDRSAVTGGKQMDGFVALLCALLGEAGVPDACVYRNRVVQLPGWFRAEKQWDLVIKVGEQLVAVLELKSQVGPSFGNNFNNRSEEAIGSASDILAAFREGAFTPSPRPWIGYSCCWRIATPRDGRSGLRNRTSKSSLNFVAHRTRGATRYCFRSSYVTSCMTLRPF